MTIPQKIQQSNIPCNSSARMIASSPRSIMPLSMLTKLSLRGQNTKVESKVFQFFYSKY